MGDWSTTFDRVPRWLCESAVSDGAIRVWCALHALCMRRGGDVLVVSHQDLAAGPPKRSVRFIQDRIRELVLVKAIEVRSTGRAIEVRMYPDRHGGAEQNGTVTPTRSAGPRRADRHDGSRASETALLQENAEREEDRGRDPGIDADELADAIDRQTPDCRPIPAGRRANWHFAVTCAMREYADVTPEGIVAGIVWLRQNGNTWQREKSGQWAYLADPSGRNLMAMLDAVDAASRTHEAAQ